MQNNKMERKSVNDPKCQVIDNIIMASSSIIVIEFKVLNQIV